MTQAYGPGGHLPVKTRLSAHLRQEAEWRDEKAVEYPEDPHNARSAEALSGRLRLTSTGCRRMTRTSGHLEALQDRYALDLFAPGNEAPSD